MKKRFLTRFSAMLIILAMTIAIMPVHTLAGAYDCSSTLGKCFNKDGKFSMPINFMLTSDVNLVIEVYLTDEGGDVICRWNEINIAAYINGNLSYTFSRSYATTPDGLYTMNVVITDTLGNSQYAAYTVNHKKVASLTYKDTYKVKNADGSYGQKFRFQNTNGKGRDYHLEIYTQNGAFVTSFTEESQYDNSVWSETWNYYPKQGVKMKTGTYILKYWVDGSTPKQVTINITI